MPGSESNRTPSLGEVARNAVSTALQYVHTSLPGIVQSYDTNTKTAEVTVALQRPRLLADGTYEMEDIGTLSGVPVHFPRGGGFFLEFPLAKGDGVLLVFTMCAHDAWRQSGEVSPPGDNRMHSLAGAVALAGFGTVANVDAHDTRTHLWLGKEGGPTINFADGLVRLGSEFAADFVALSSKVDSNFEAIKTLLVTTGLPVIGGGGGNAKAASLDVQATGAAKVTAE